MMHSIQNKVCIGKLKVIDDISHELSRNPGASKRHFLNMSNFESGNIKHDNEDNFWSD